MYTALLIGPVVPGPYPYLLEEGYGPMNMFAIPTKNKMVSSEEATKLVKAGITLMGPLVPSSNLDGQICIRNNSDFVNKMNQGYKNHRSYSVRAKLGYPEKINQRGKTKTYRSNSMRLPQCNAKKMHF